VDGILSALGGGLPQLGIGGTLAFVIGLLVKLLIDERTRHTAELDAISKRHADELQRKGDRLAAENEREQAQHIADLTDLRAELRDARKRIDELELTVDIERAARRDAEDAAARALRGYGGGA
jgi:hypothetical protein